MDLIKIAETPHRRFNPLTREWVLVSPQRMLRPWQGKVETLSVEEHSRYEPDCYLCPGNFRVSGVANPNYGSTFIFENDYAALLPNVQEITLGDSDLLVATTERGICRVGCFSPRHDLTISRLSADELRLVIEMWIDQYRELGVVPWINDVQIFENRGSMMGASNPHPHCQIWATARLSNQSSREQAAFGDYGKEHGSCLLCDYMRLEQSEQKRIICENAAFVVLVPFWAVWPFETLMLSKRHVGSMADLNDTERDLMGDIMKRVTTRYDNLFEVSFPYTMGFHQQPTDSQPHPEWHLHAHYYPPLLRSATIQKFMVGYEMLGTAQRDIAPESAAEGLRKMAEVHYRDRGERKDCLNASG